MENCLRPRLRLYFATRLYSSYALKSPLARRLMPSCKACGVPFHRDPNNQLGYPASLDATSERKESVKVMKEKRVEELFKNLSSEKRDFLNQSAARFGLSNAVWSTGTDSIAKLEADQKRKARAATRKSLCRYCFDERAGLHAHELAALPNMASLDEQFAMLPERATVIHVMDGTDFPASIDPRVVEWQKKGKGKVLWVVNRADLLVTQQFKSMQRALPYMRHVLGGFVGAKPQNIFVVSALAKWNLDHLFSAMTKDNYLIGYTNVGKSLLARSLLQKFGERLSDENKMADFSISSVPWRTRAPMFYDLEDSKTVVDMPAIPEENCVYEILKPKELKKVVKGHLLLKDPGRYNAQRVVTKPGQLTSIGGLVLLEHESNNPGLVTISWAIVADGLKKTRVVASMDKALRIASNTVDQHVDWTFADPSRATEYKHLMDINFKGEGVSLAIRGVGVVQVHANGKIPDDGVKLRVYGLPNVKVQCRENILPFLRDTGLKDLRAASLERVQKE